MIGSVEAFVAALRSTPLLPDEQTNLAISFASSFQDVQEYAKHLVRQKIISLYQAKKILANRTHELVIGSYVVVDKLGEGGMGKVYKAIQTRMKRLVALKVVKASLLKNEIALKRFQREMKAASSLTHPNIVRVFDADQIGDRYFLAMEYIEGPDLSKLVKESGPLDIGTACSLVRQAALGLQHAHDMGIVHRDIKPSNILVSVGASGTVGPDSQAKILDMGLARAMAQEEDGVTVTELTRAGTVVGTPDYMSPEQAKNSSLVDGRSDLYSLGCTLFYLVTGEVVFPHGNALEKLMSHQMDAPRSSQLIRFDVPTEVDQIIQTLLSKKPSERFQSGAALAQALSPFCRGENTTIPSTVLLAEAVEGDSSGTVTTAPPRDPFDFRSTEAVKAQVPSSTPIVETPRTTGKTKVRPSTFREGIKTSTPPPITNTQTKAPASPQNANRRPKKTWLFILLALLATLSVLIVGLILILSLLGNHEQKEKAPKSAAAEPELEKPSVSQQPPKKAPLKKERLLPETIEPFTKYCPDQATGILHLNLRNIAISPGAKYLLPYINKQFAEMSEIAGIDLSIALENLTLVLAPTKDKMSSTIEDENFLWIVQGHHFVDDDSRKAFSSLAGVTSEVVLPTDSHNGILYTYKRTPKVKFYFALFDTPSVAILSNNKDQVIEAIQKKCTSRITKFQDESISTAIGRGFVNTPKAAHREMFMIFGVKHSWGWIDPREYGLEYLILGLNFENRGLVFDLSASGPEKALSKFHNDFVSRLKNQARTVEGPTSRAINSIHDVVSKFNWLENKISTARLQHMRYTLSSDKIENFLEPFLPQKEPRK